jgi:predicted GIY-YIG superfamily endonuclease
MGDATDLEAQTALYRFFDEEGGLLYVGITQRFGQRWSTHMRTKPWWSDVRSHTAQWYADRPTAAAAEVEAIKTEKPRHNVMHARAKLPKERAEIVTAEMVLAMEAVGSAGKEFAELQTLANEAKQLLFDACADAVRAGDTPDKLAAWLRSNKTPEQIEAGLSFTSAHLRKKIRERGVAPLRTGPKPRKPASSK